MRFSEAQTTVMISTVLLVLLPSHAVHPPLPTRDQLDEVAALTAAVQSLLDAADAAAPEPADVAARYEAVLNSQAADASLQGASSAQCYDDALRALEDGTHWLVNKDMKQPTAAAHLSDEASLQAEAALEAAEAREEAVLDSQADVASLQGAPSVQCYDDALRALEDGTHWLMQEDKRGPTAAARLSDGAASLQAEAALEAAEARERALLKALRRERLRRKRAEARAGAPARARRRAARSAVLTTRSRTKGAGATRSKASSS